MEYATEYNMGEWDGQETLAANNMNRIYIALEDAGADEDAMIKAFDRWGNDEALLTITDAMIAQYVCA